MLVFSTPLNSLGCCRSGPPIWVNVLAILTIMLWGLNPADGQASKR